MPDQSSAASEHALIQEITAPLETLPDDPLALVEADFPTTMRGYDRHAVDDYVEQVSRLVAELHATRSPEAAVRRALERVGDQISGILRRAHETAEQITAQSRVEAEDRLEQARREAGSILEAAEHRVRELDADTDRVWSERQQIVADVEGLSQRLHEVARDAGERFPGEEARAPGTGAGAVGPAGAELVDHETFEGPEPAEAYEDPAALREPESFAEAGAFEDDDAFAEAGAFEDDEPLEDADDLAGAEPLEDADDLAGAETVEDADDLARADLLDTPDDLDAGGAPLQDPGAPQGAPEPEATGDEPEEEDPGIERTVPYPPQRPTQPAGREDEEDEEHTEPLPRRLTDDDSTQIIPPASDAAQHRRES